MACEKGKCLYVRVCVCVRDKVACLWNEIGFKEGRQKCGVCPPSPVSFLLGVWLRGSCRWGGAERRARASSLPPPLLCALACHNPRLPLASRNSFVPSANTARPAHRRRRPPWRGEQFANEDAPPPPFTAAAKIAPGSLAQSHDDKYKTMLLLGVRGRRGGAH